MSGLAETLHRLVAFLDSRGVEHMLIGGHALPFYGRIRATLDIDIAVMIEGEKEYDELILQAARDKYDVALGSFNNPMCIFLDTESGYEIEVWTRPDGIDWDHGTLNRRRRVNIADTETWIVSPEDFIVSKLARPDRGTIDEQDVKSVIERDDVKLDWEYLETRAKRHDVWSLLQMIRER